MTCSHMSYFFISKQLLWELFFRISNSNGKYEGIFTLKPSIAMTFPIKMRHSYVLLFKYIDQDTIKSIRACIMCSKQREDAEGMTLWLTQETESIAILIESESCSVTSKNSWIALSVHEL